MNFKGFRWKVNFFANDASFEKLLKVIHFTYVFENGEKCNCLLMTVFFMLLCKFHWMNVKGFRWKVNLFVNEVSFEKLLNMMDLLMFLNIVKHAIVYWCLCFHVLCRTIFHWMTFKGFKWKVNFLVNDVSFEKMLNVLRFTYVFENG